MGTKKDYRNTDQCLALTEVATKKEALEEKIRNNHKRAKIIYNKIKDKQGEYYKEFAAIYNFKCAYCGASLKFTDGRLFEVDHYVCESAFSKDITGRAEAGKIENLTFSCYSCNRGKGRLHIKNDYVSILNPDNNSIATMFFRDEKYYIRVSPDCNKDEFVQLFYEQLLLGNESRRLDYLLMEMNNLISNVQSRNTELANQLGQCMSNLIKKKNCAFI